jgi:HD superfamily phosphohydrolase
MYEIIANKKNSLDVDKLDYLYRDSKNLGLISEGFDIKRII